jgi:hypothetical protein
MAGMMPRNTLRKGSVSCSSSSSSRRGWNKISGCCHARCREKGGEGVHVQCRCLRHMQGQIPYFPPNPTLSVQGTLWPPPHLAQGVPRLLEPVNGTEPGQQDAHGQDHQVDLRSRQWRGPGGMSAPA